MLWAECTLVTAAGRDRPELCASVRWVGLVRYSVLSRDDCWVR